MPHHTAWVLLILLSITTAASAANPITIEAPAPTTAPAAIESRDDLGARLKAAAEQHRADVAAQLDFQLYRSLNQSTTAAPDDLSGLSPEDRDIVTTIIQGLSKFRSVAQAPASPTLAQKIEPLLAMADNLRDRANLTLENLTLCQSVERFGIYEPLASATFTAGTDSPVIVYFEVQNFHPRQTQAGMWETRLKYELALYPDNTPSKPIFSKPTTPVIDQSRTRRHDFFIADKIILPRKLTPGKYTLKITLTDTLAHRVGEATLPIQLLP